MASCVVTGHFKPGRGGSLQIVEGPIGNADALPIRLSAFERPLTILRGRTVKGHFKTGHSGSLLTVPPRAGHPQAHCLATTCPRAGT